ncbi:putative alpha/beta hydrolase family esterase [Crossiella equi]|uniref:Alpha/beta hydrolase family esterase n=1 Tax=Crossiella equi TaxID=130796 RepID=A0ABS5AC90_9PSEU|nr:alpha/beta hydrolase [Crossiella equi]MBP2474203.1 putative alpha/beta hydrolase family esterase [Crossiella equi]
MRALHVVLLPGWRGAPREHWLTWLAAELRGAGVAVDQPVLPDPDRPSREAWLPPLRASLAAAPPSADLVVLGHSLGATLWLHHARTLSGRDRRAHRVLLVSPPAPSWAHPEVHGFNPPPLDARSLRRAASTTRLVVGQGDPYCSRVDAYAYARALGVDLDLVPGGEQLDGDTGYGAWPSVLDWTLGRAASPVDSRTALRS